MGKASVVAHNGGIKYKGNTSRVSIPLIFPDVIGDERTRSRG